MKLFGFDIPYADEIKGGLGLLGGILGTSNSSNTGSGIADILRRREQSDYEYGQKYNAAAQAYNTQAMANAASNRAASQAAAGARRAAAMATEANRQKAAKKSMKTMDKTYKETMDMYAPFQQSALQLLPQMQKNFEGGMNMSNDLLKLIQQPQNMELLYGAKPASMLGPKLPSSFRGG